jgi:hypothetical protein
MIHLVVLRVLCSGSHKEKPQRSLNKHYKFALLRFTYILQKQSSSRYTTIERILLLVDTHTTNCIYNSVPNFTFQVSLVWM